jgi:hypothetical protein
VSNLRKKRRMLLGSRIAREILLYAYVFGSSAILASFFPTIPVAPRFPINFLAYSIGLLLFRMKQEFDDFKERLE